MRLTLLILAGLSVCALPAAAQTKEPGIGPVFHQALLACANPTDGGLDMWSACTGVRFGVMEAYLDAASICVATRSQADCDEAKKLEKHAQEVLKGLSRR